MAITLLQKRRPLEDLMRYFGDWDSWLDQDFSVTGYDGIWNPAVDIVKTDDKYLLRADIPGVKKEDLHVELKDGYLILKGYKGTDHEEMKHSYHSYERSYGCFERKFRVPAGLSEKDIKAKYHDGVLELSIPVPEAEKPKIIDIKIE